MTANTAAARLSRLLALVPWLSVNDGVTMEEAAAHFGISVAQLEKDLNLLIVCGLPGYTHAELVDIQFWDDGIIHVLDPQTLGRPLRLSGDEAMALIIALRLLAQIPGDHDRAVLLSATHRLQEAVGAVDADAIVVDVDVDPGLVDLVHEVIATGRDLRIEYGGVSDQITVRDIHPLRTVSHDGRTYVEALCHSAGALRTFRLDRILRAEIIAPADEDASAIEAPQRPQAQAVRIRAAAPWAAEALGLEPAGALTGTVSVFDEDWLVRTVLSLGGAAEVLEPARLRAAVADAAAAALASYA